MDERRLLTGEEMSEVAHKLMDDLIGCGLSGGEAVIVCLRAAAMVVAVAELAAGAVETRKKIEAILSL
jgi:hypothetical protein